MLSMTSFSVAFSVPTIPSTFRVSCLKQRGRYTAILRLIPDELLTFDQIGLPEPVQELLRRPRGLILSISVCFPRARRANGF